MEIHELQEMITPEAGFYLPIDSGDATYKLNFSKVGNPTIQNNLTTETAGDVLDASQGRVLNEKVIDLSDNVANSESGDSSEHAYAKGDIFFYDGVMHIAKRAIAAGANLTEGTNMEPATVASAISERISTNQIAAGTINTTVSSYSSKTVTATFGKSLRSTPIGVASLASNTTIYQYGSISVTVASVSTGAINIVIFNNTANSYPVYVNYIAVAL